MESWPEMTLFLKILVSRLWLLLVPWADRLCQTVRPFFPFAFAFLLAACMCPALSIGVDGELFTCLILWHLRWKPAENMRRNFFDVSIRGDRCTSLRISAYLSVGDPPLITVQWACMMLRRIFAAASSALVLLGLEVVEAALCDSTTVTEPVSLRDSTGWDKQDVIGAGERKQGHVSAEILAWGQEHIVIYGGTSVRTDDVNDVTAGGTDLYILDISNPTTNWTDLEMVGESFVYTRIYTIAP